MERYEILKQISLLLDDANVPYTSYDDGELDFICGDTNYLTCYISTDELYDVVRDVHYSLFE